MKEIQFYLLNYFHVCFLMKFNNMFCFFRLEENIEPNKYDVYEQITTVWKVECLWCLPQMKSAKFNNIFFSRLQIASLFIAESIQKTLGIQQFVLNSENMCASLSQTCQDMLNKMHCECCLVNDKTNV